MLAHTAQAIDERLRARLAPTQLEVLDQSYQHDGHAGANGTGFGTHFRVQIASPQFANLTHLQSDPSAVLPRTEFIDQGLHALAIEVVR